MNTCTACSASEVTRWPPRDPREPVIVEFDFSGLGLTVSGVTVAVAGQYSPLGAKDPNPAAILSGAPTISGALVRQAINGGVDMVDYVIECIGTPINLTPKVIAAVLPVRTK